jgi:NTE family protein
VIEEMLKNDFEIVSIAGTSVGSLIGGLYANGHLSEFKNWILNLDQSKVFDLVDLTFNSQGFVKGDRVFDEMRKFIPDVNIEQLMIPFVAVTADLNSHEEIRISRGKLFEAIRSSVAVPSVLTPMNINGQLLVDGGVVNPLPISAIPKANADLIVAVDLNSIEKYVPIEVEKEGRIQDKEDWMERMRKTYSISFKEYFFTSNKAKTRLNYFDIINSSFELMQDKLTEVVLERYQPDMLVKIPRTSASTFDFYKGEELIAYGRQAFKQSFNEFQNRT